MHNFLQIIYLQQITRIYIYKYIIVQIKKINYLGDFKLFIGVEGEHHEDEFEILKRI